MSLLSFMAGYTYGKIFVKVLLPAYLKINYETTVLFNGFCTFDKAVLSEAGSRISRH